MIAAQFDAYKALHRTCCAHLGFVNCEPSIGGAEGATRLLATPVAQVMVESAVQHNSQLSFASGSAGDLQQLQAADGPAAMWTEEQPASMEGMQEERKQQATLLRKLSRQVSSKPSGMPLGQVDD